MDFAFTETQTDLRDAVRRYLDDSYPVTRVAEIADGTGYDADAWPELCRQGWLDQDLDLVDLAVLAEESGRALHPTPWWTTAALTLPAYAAAGTAPDGPATLVDGSTGCRAVPDGDGHRISGLVAAVVDARAASELVVAADTGRGVALFAVRPGPEVTDTPRTGIDPLRGLSDVEFDAAPARLLVAPPAAAEVLTAIARRAAVLLSAEAVGVAGRALELAVDHAKVREQFDRPIGSYQAVAHLLAESYAELELARSLAYRAACVLRDRAEQTGPVEQALACAVHAGGRAATTVCEAAVQVSGGIGVTWEFPLHRWYRRALWLDAYHAARTDPLATLATALLG
jgi:alkylation response protein AidB-like acyl-CoA dehydrogenase